MFNQMFFLENPKKSEIQIEINYIINYDCIKDLNIG